MNAVICLENVRKHYSRTLRTRAHEALKGISLEISEGEVFGFIGPNGAGKSTTIKIITGISRPSSGDVRLFGLDCRDASSRYRVGYVPESPSLYDYLTPLELLSMGLSLHGVKLTNERRHCMEWLSRLGLGHVAETQIKTFSKGMAQRTALAHALCIQPRLLVLDEPLSGLDPVGRREVIDLLAEFRSAGGTVFFSSHVLYDVERLADRFGLIHEGELLTLRSPQELADEQSNRFLVVYQCANPVDEASRCLRERQFEREIDEPELPLLLGVIAARGGRLVEVRPGASLESVFFSVIRNKDNDDGPNVDHQQCSESSGSGKRL